jgi:hypothetical protein
MKFTVENDYGCTKHNSVSDMDCQNGTLIEQLDNAGIAYTLVELSMGSDGSAPCNLIHYTGKSNNPITVLIVPSSGIDSWAENYYHFPGMSDEDAKQLKWYDVYQHIHDVWWKTVKSKIQVAQFCPKCHTAPVTTYDDIRGNLRCATCHTHTVENKAEFWK